MKKNSLNAFRKRMQKSFIDYVDRLNAKFIVISGRFNETLINQYEKYCRKMLFCTLAACFFNVFFVVVIILATL